MFNAMLDQIELVFNWLKSFNLKIKPKKCYFFQASMVCLAHVLSADGISANPEKVDKSERLAGAKECQGITFIPSFHPITASLF